MINFSHRPTLAACVRDARTKLPSRASRLQAAKLHPQPQPSQLHREQDFEGKQLRRVNGISDQGNGKLRPVGANLAHFKAPHSVTFVKELPKTATGKIQICLAGATECDRGAVRARQQGSVLTVDTDTSAYFPVIRLPGTAIVCRLAQYEHLPDRPERDDARHGLLSAHA